MDRLMLGYTMLPTNLRFKGRIPPRAYPQPVDGLCVVMGGLDLRAALDNSAYTHGASLSGGWIGMGFTADVSPLNTVASDATFTSAVAFGASARQSYERGAG